MIFKSCAYQSRIRDRGQFACALGWYNGSPWLGNCIDCIKNKRNNPEAKAGFDAKQTAKPSIKIGCCGGSYPKMGQMASTFIEAIKDEAISIISREGSIDQNTIDKRIDTCNSCDFFVKKNERCIKCGCFIKLKARMRSQTCPIGKW